jgi:sugar/nucleoside kinase (ribokinase family)
MNTYLGISSELGPEDVSDGVAGDASVLFLEGYLYDKPRGKQAFERAAKLCQQAGGQAGIALSDPFCVDRHRDSFRTLVKDLDYVIGNEHEWASLYQTDLDAALAQAAQDAGLVVCTRSGDEVIVIRGETRAVVPVHRVVPVDATGAGDLFAAGFLYGMVTGRPLDVAGRMGCVAAAEVISHFGARPEVALADLFAAEGLI